MQRAIRALLPKASVPQDGAMPLERLVPATEPARLVRAELIEGRVMRARPIHGEPKVGFRAFLDGTQSSHVLAYAEGGEGATTSGISIVHGTVAAVIRVRRQRRLTTWRRPVVTRRIYAPMALLSAEWRAVLQQLDLAVVDTSSSEPDASSPSHPFTLRDEAIHRVQRDREAAEHELAERWCAAESEPIFVDGGISGSERVAVSTQTVGVVKSHRTLYADGTALRVILNLRAAERSSVLRVTSPKRTTVASWYLRLREWTGHDPMWGLVRVEIAYADHADEETIGTRADEVSRWILAEVSPLALPDSRWDKMVYGVRDCEEFLRAIA